MKMMLTFFLLVIAPSVFANQNVTLSPVTFQVNTEAVLSKFERTILNPENLLKRFKPVGAKITNKRVSQNVISFVATKTVLFVSKSVYVNGVLESTGNNRACPKEDVGYGLKMSFDSSDNLVTDNVEELQAIICLHSQSDSKIIGTVLSRIVIGNKYSNPLGPIAINLIKEQVSPLLSAVVEEIKSMK